MFNYYCFVNLKDNKIFRISPINKLKDEDPETLIFFKIDNDLAKDLLTGKKSYASMMLMRDENGYFLAEKELILKKFEKNFNLIDTLPLLEIIENTKNDYINVTDIKLTINIKEKTIEIDIIKEILQLINEPIQFYITNKNDPSKLIDIITLDKNINTTTFKCECLNSDISIFTRRIFNNYYLEIINE